MQRQLTIVLQVHWQQVMLSFLYFPSIIIAFQFRNRILQHYFFNSSTFAKAGAAFFVVISTVDSFRPRVEALMRITPCWFVDWIIASAKPLNTFRELFFIET